MRSVVAIENSFAILIQSYLFTFALENAVAPNFVMARLPLEIRRSARYISGKFASDQIRLNRCMLAVDHTDQQSTTYSEEFQRMASFLH